MPSRDEVLMEDIYNRSKQGPVALPLGGTVSMAGGDPVQGMTFNDPAGGSFTIPRDRVDNNPGMVGFLTTGIPSYVQREQEQRRAREMDQMAKVDALVGRMQARRDAKKQAEDEAMLRGAEQRRDSGQMTVDDALRLGFIKQRYQDFGMPAQDFINQMFNEPRRGDNAQQEQRRMAVLDASLKNDNLRPTTTIFDESGRVNPALNFEAKPEPAPKAEVYNPGGGVGLFERTPDGQYRPIEGTSKPPAAVAPAPPVPVEQFGGFYRTWDEQAGAWGSWKQKDAARGDPYMEAMAANYRKLNGLPPAATGDGIDWSTIPQYGQQPAAAKPAAPAASQGMGQHEQANAAAKAAGKAFYEIGGVKYKVQ